MLSRRTLFFSHRKIFVQQFTTTVTKVPADSKLTQAQNSLLEEFWKKQTEKIHDLKIEEREEFKNLTDLPLARIKRIMKADDDVRMIRAEAPVLFAKACELFILELTLRSYHFTEAKARNNLTKEDVHSTVSKTGMYDFLIQILQEREQTLRKKLEVKLGSTNHSTAMQTSDTTLSSTTLPSSSAAVKVETRTLPAPP